MTGDDERRAAEEYRQQRQRADAKRHGFEAMTVDAFFRWIENNHGVLLAIARANGASEHDAPALVEQYKAMLRDAPTGSEFDDKNAQIILTNVLAQIEAVCSDGNIPIRSGVVFGIAPELGALASQRRVVTTDVSIITVSLPFITFCNVISKAMAQTLVHQAGNPGRAYCDPAKVAAKLHSRPDLILEWSRMLAHFAAFGWPPPTKLLALDEMEQVTRGLILIAIERFSIAHEYGHHIMGHGQSESSEETRDPFYEEYEADIFARAISMALAAREGAPNGYAMYGAGGVIVLGMLELVRRAKAMLETGDDRVAPRQRHPPYVDRVAALAGMDQHLNDQDQPAAVDMRACFEKIIEIIWDVVRPVLLGLHRSGLRPQSGAPDVGGWLPS